LINVKFSEGGHCVWRDLSRELKETKRATYEIGNGQTNERGDDSLFVITVGAGTAFFGGWLLIARQGPVE